MDVAQYHKSPKMKCTYCEFVCDSSELLRIHSNVDHTEETATTTESRNRQSCYAKLEETDELTEIVPRNDLHTVGKLRIVESAESLCNEKTADHTELCNKIIEEKHTGHLKHTGENNPFQCSV